MEFASFAVHWQTKQLPSVVVGGISAACGSTALVLVPLEFQIARNYPIQQPTILAVLFFFKSFKTNNTPFYRSWTKNNDQLSPEII